MAKDTRILFDKDFYILQAILKSEKFNRLRKGFYEKLNQFEIPMPRDGFKSVAVKHPKEKHFYIFDPNYYINAQKNIVDRKLIALRLTFSSSSINRQKDFVILNEGEDTERFQLKELTK